MDTLDPTVLNLAKAIKLAETGEGDTYKKTGKSGEFGAYQFMPDTYKNYAQKYIGNANAEPTVENQNKIAYSFIKEKKDAGYNPSQIASMWNAGEGKPNAYKEGWKGVNEHGVAYDTPAYALKVSQHYKELSQRNTPTQTTPEAQPEEPKKDLLQKTGDIVNKIFPGGKVGEAIGTLGGYGLEKLKGLFGGKDNSEFYDLSAPTPLQVGADVAQGALMVGSGLGGKSVGVFGKTIPTLKTAGTVGGRIAQSVGLGAGFGLTGGLKEGKTNAGELAKDTAVGGLVGGVAGGIGEGISKLAEVLPRRIANSFIKGKGMGEKEIDYAIKKGLGSPSKMLSESESSINSMGGELDKILTSKQYADFKVPGRDILNKVVQDFPDAGLSRVDVLKKIQSIVPLKANLVDRLLRGNLTLKELHTLNSALGKNTFKTVFDGVEVKANKEIGSALYHSISDIIKNVAPETQPIFADLSKEYPLRSSLEQLILRGQKAKVIDLNTILSFLTGSAVGSPLAGLGAVGAEKILTSPAVNLRTAGLLNKIGGKTAQQLGQGLKAPIIKGLTDITR